MSALFLRLQAELTAARKSQDKARTLLLGTTLAEVRNREIELRRELVDDDVVEVLRRGIKKRRESIQLYEKGNRPELAEKESAEVGMLERFLPPLAGPEEIRAAVRDAIAAGARNVGAVMGQIMPRFKGKADGNAISAIVREELASQ